MAFGLICGIGQLVLLIPTDVTFWYMKDASGLTVGDTVKAVYSIDHCGSGKLYPDPYHEFNRNISDVVLTVK
ncbi:MAG: hypothetical protein ACLTFJ_08370 [Clostridium sp.]